MVGERLMSETLASSAQKVHDAILARGLNCEVRELPDTTRTAQEAAHAIGCAVAQIAKSIVFRTTVTDAPVLVIASGTNRIDERRLTALVCEEVKKADASFVRERTGFVIGGVPPVGHGVTINTFIDEDLMAFDSVWVAAGTPNAVCKVTPNELTTLTQGSVVSIKAG